MTVKIGFIGAGSIASFHMNSLRKIDGVEIVSVFDVNRESALKAAESLGARVADQAEDVLDPKMIDAVYLCVPQFARGNLDELAASRGIHLFVEKPLGLDLDEVRRKAKAIADSGVINSVGYCLRYLETVQQAKAYLRDRVVHLVQAYRFGGGHHAQWWFELDKSGGHMVDAVTHQVDMIRYVVGEFKEIDARFSRVSFDHLQKSGSIYDAGAVVFSMERGAVGTITESCLATLHGKADVKVFGPDFFLHLSHNGTALTIIDESTNETIRSQRDPYYEQAKAFVTAVREGSQEPILSSYTDGLKTLAATLAGNQSFKTGQPVTLSDVG